MNNYEKMINEIKEGHKLIEKNYDLLSNSISYKWSKEGVIEYEYAYSCDLFEYAHYLFYKKRLIKGQLVGKKYHYYDIKTGDFIEEYTNAKRPTKSRDEETINTELFNYSVKNGITGLAMNHRIKDSNRKLEIHGELTLPHNFSSFIYLNNQLISVSVSYGSIFYSSTVLQLKNKYLSNSDFSNLAKEVLFERFNIEKELPEDVKLKSMRDIGLNCDSTFMIGYDEKMNKFYIKPDSKYKIHSEDKYSVNAKEYKGIKYIDIDSDLFYVDGDTIKYTCLNREYSNKVKDVHVMFDEDFNVKFLDKPYAKFIRQDNGFIVYKDNSVEIDSIHIEAESKEDRYCISNSNLAIIDVINEDYEVIPIKMKINYGRNIKTVFIVGSDNGFSVYLYPEQDMATLNILTLPNYLRFGRKKSEIFVYDNYICKSCGEGDYALVDAKNFDLTTLKAISVSSYRVTGYDGYDYISTSKGLFKLNFPYEEYDSIETSDNVVATFKGVSYVNGIKFYQDGPDRVIISKDGYEDIALENTSINIDEQSDRYIYTTYPYKVLEQDVNNLKFYLNGRYHNTFTEKAKILYENELLVVYSINNDNKTTTYFYSNITKDCISSNKINLPRNHFYGADKKYSEKVFELPIQNYISVCGYFIKYDKLDTFSKGKGTILSLLIDNLNKKELVVKSHDEVRLILDNTLYEVLVDLANKYELNITKDDIINCKSIKNLNLILPSISNLYRYVNKSKYKDILKEIENAIKGKDTLNSELFNECNRKNEIEFKHLGLSLDKFNNFDKIVEFQASSGDDNGIKESLSTDLYTQLEILLGSRTKSIRGFLQLDSLSSLSELYSKYIGEKIDISLLLSDTKGDSLTNKQVVKEINKLGFKFYGIMKKYDITLDLVNNSILIANKSYTACKFKKITSVANDMILVTKKACNDINNNAKFNDYTKEVLNKILAWSISHIEEAVSNIDENVESHADHTESMYIKLWDRYDILEALTQGNKTHCCLAVNSFNIHELVKYIYNKNINLVEIRNKNGVIGQAFVSLYRTKNKMNYRYENKHHLFMIIDNVELNNNYAMYSDDIARNLQKFMNLYMLHISDKISDVFLGTCMNDIRPPYEFKQRIDVNIVGEDELYLDHSSEFYKFI